MRRYTVSVDRVARHHGSDESILVTDNFTRKTETCACVEGSDFILHEDTDAGTLVLTCDRVRLFGPHIVGNH